MPDIYIADVSEWQGVVDWNAYPYPAVICRVNYGSGYLDRMINANLAGARKRCQLRGWYTYLIAGQAPEPQADALADVLLANGGLLAQEFVACDDEEGAGDQAPRVQAFFDRLHARLHEPTSKDWVYAGLYFARTHLGNLNANTHRWLAGYGMAETADPHQLWQFTSGAQVPGIKGNVDCSIFHGTLDQLTALVGAAPTAPQEDDSMPNLLVQGDQNDRDPRGPGAVYFVANWPAGPKHWVPNNAVLAAYKLAGLGDIKVVNQYVLDDIRDESGHYESFDPNAVKAELDQIREALTRIEAEHLPAAPVVVAAPAPSVDPAAPPAAKAA